MQKTALIALLALLLPASSLPVLAQSAGPETAPRQNWPLVVSVQFHSLSMPFRDLKTTFGNVGIGLGTEVAYNRRAHWLQNVQIGYYRNQNAGNGLFISSQAVYRPHIGPIFAELKAGLGWNYTFHPNTTLVFQQGEWQSAGRVGRSLLMIPLGVGFGYDGRKHTATVVPFVNYQFFVLQGYNPSIPLIPNQLIQIGSKIHFTR